MLTSGFIYTVDPEAEEPIMLINNHIGFDPDDGMGIDGAQFQNELLALDGMNKKSIQVWINSPGGSVMDGYNIYTSILKSKTKVDTHCTGMAASIAAVIFQAGRNRVMSDYGFLMYHNPHGPSDRKLIDMMTDSLAKMTARSGKPVEDIQKMMNKETYIDADEALEYGLCDSIEKSEDSNKKRATPTMAFYKEAKMVLNSLFPQDKNDTKMAFNKVAARLNLNHEASEDSIVAEIDRIQNKAKDEKDASDKKKEALDKKIKDIEEELDKLKAEKKDLSDAKDKAEKDCEEAKKEGKDAKDKADEEEAKNFLQAYAKAGKIKNEKKVLDFWTALYKADKVVTKEQLDAIPLNKVSVKIEQTSGENADENALTMVAAKAMADVRNKLKM